MRQDRIKSQSRGADRIVRRPMNKFAIKYSMAYRRCSLLPAAGHRRAGLLVRSELVGAFDRHQFGQPRACAVDARFDGADRAAANMSSLLVRKSRSADQDEGLALVRRQ